MTIPLVHTTRGEFSGATINLRAWSCGLGSVPGFDAEIKADGSQAVLDLATMKTEPGEYVLTFYGSAVAKYRYYPEQIEIAKAAFDQAKERAEKLR